MTGGIKLDPISEFGTDRRREIDRKILKFVKKERNDSNFKNWRICFKPQVFDSFEESVTWLPPGYLVFNNKNSSQPPGLWLTTG